MESKEFGLFWNKLWLWVKHGTRLTPVGDGHRSRIKMWQDTVSGKLKTSRSFLFVLSNRDIGHWTDKWFFTSHASLECLSRRASCPVQTWNHQNNNYSWSNISRHWRVDHLRRAETFSQVECKDIHDCRSPFNWERKSFIAFYSDMYTHLNLRILVFSASKGSGKGAAVMPVWGVGC